MGSAVKASRLHERRRQEQRGGGPPKTTEVRTNTEHLEVHCYMVTRDQRDGAESGFGEVMGASAGWKGFERKGQEEPESKHRRRGSAAKETTSAKGGGDGRRVMARALLWPGSQRGSARRCSRQCADPGAGRADERGGERVLRGREARRGRDSVAWGRMGAESNQSGVGAWETAWRAHRTF